VFLARLARGGLYQAAASSGVAAPLTTLLEREVAPRLYPVLLPDGKHFLYERHGYEAGVGGVFLGSLDAAPAEQASKEGVAGFGERAYVASSETGKGIRAVVAKRRSLHSPSMTNVWRWQANPSRSRKRLSANDPDTFRAVLCS